MKTFTSFSTLGGSQSGKPAWVTPGSTVDLWMQHSRYWALGRRYLVANVPGLDAYAFENFEATSIKGLATVTRAGVGTVVQDGSVVSVAAGMPRVGTESVIRRNAYPQSDTGWAQNGGSRTILDTTDAGFTRRRVSSLGATWHRTYRDTSGNTIGVGQTVYVRVRYEAGTSGKIFINTQHNYVTDFEVIWTIGSPGAGVTETDMGGGVYEATFSYVADYATASSFIIGVGPYSAVSGEDLILHGVQATDKFSPWIFSTPSTKTTASVGTGLVVEEARTFSVLHNSDLSDAVWTSAGQTEADDAVRLGLPFSTATVSTTGTFRSTINSGTLTLANNAYCSISAYVYDGTSTQTALRLNATGSHTTFGITWASGVPSSSGVTSAGMTPGTPTFTYFGTDGAGKAIYRVSIVTQNTSGGPLDYSASCYSAWDVSQTAGATSYWSTVQVEAGAFVTSPVQVGATPVTRPADSVTIPTSLFDFNAAAGTVFFKGRVNNPASDASFRRIVSINDGTISNEISIQGASGAIRGFVLDGGASQAVFSNSTWTGTKSVAIAWEANSIGFSVDGTSSTPDTSATIPTGLTNFDIFESASLNASGECEELYYYNTRLTNAQIEGLSAGTIDPATLSPVLSLDFINRTYSRGGDPFAETVLSDNFSGYGSTAELATAWVLTETGASTVVFDVINDEVDLVVSGSDFVSISGGDLIVGQAYELSVTGRVSAATTNLDIYDGVTTTPNAMSASLTTSDTTVKFSFVATGTGPLRIARPSSGQATNDTITLSNITTKRVELYLTGIDTTLGLSATESFDLVFDDATTSTQAAVGGELTLVATNNPLARVTA